MLRRIRELFNDVFRQADLVLLALCIGTSLFGILMIASATRYMHTSKLVLVQAAAEKGYIRPEQVERLIRFRNNPSDESWMHN